ncbi:MAG: ATP-binding protein, partial [Bacilli bacterium]
KKYSLSRQIKEIILLLEPQWSAKNIEVELSGEQVDIFADQDLLSQVWINLLNNSIKFTKVSGKISISIRKNEGEIEITIADMGIGMTREELAHIFERFYMADKARSRKMGGSGLGLSIVKKIVQMHSGYINVDSKKDIGTTFKVIIPQNIELV